MVGHNRGQEKKKEKKKKKKLSVAIGTIILSFLRIPILAEIFGII